MGAFPFFADIAEIESGGYLFYDSTRPIPESKFHKDIEVIGVPLTEISNAAYSEPRQRQLSKKTISVIYYMRQHDEFLG